MSLSPEHARDQTETSCFGYLSLPAEAGDAPPAEGYALQHHLQDFDLQHHTHEGYAPSEGSFTDELYGPFAPAKQADTSSPKGAASGILDPYAFSPLSPGPSSSSSPSLSAPLPDVPQHFFHSSASVPPPALDLANASLEMTFADNNYDGFNNYPVHSATSPFIPDTHAFDLSPLTELSSFSDPAAPSSTGYLSPLPSVSIHNLSSATVSSTESFDLPESFSSPAIHRPSLPRTYVSDDLLFARGRLYSPRFPAEHRLNTLFVRQYLLGDELGAGGYGFVMTARHRAEGNEVAVKFIIKTKVPDHAWVEDGYGGRVPSEVMLLGGLNHPNIVKCFELYEDELYYYMVRHSRRQRTPAGTSLTPLVQVQELHGTPWVSKKEKKVKQPTAPGSLSTPSISSPPQLTPSLSTDSMLDSTPSTPAMSPGSLDSMPSVAVSLESPVSPEQGSAVFAPPHVQATPALREGEKENNTDPPEYHGLLLRPPLPLPPQVRPNFTRRASYDLFECIEQSKHKRLSESQARYIFAQVVEAVYYLESKGITHCDIKDENLLVDSELKVRVLDRSEPVVALTRHCARSNSLTSEVLSGWTSPLHAARTTTSSTARPRTHPLRSCASCPTARRPRRSGRSVSSCRTCLRATRRSRRSRTRSTGASRCASWGPRASAGRRSR